MAEQTWKLGQNPGRLYVKPEGTDDWIRMAAIRNLTVIADNTEETEINSDDEGTLIRTTNQQVRVECDFLKPFDPELFGKLFNLEVAVVNGAEVEGEEQVLTSGQWTSGVFYELENQNGDGTAPTINSVTGATDGALTADDDYELIKVGGVWGLVFQSAANGGTLTTLAQNVTIDYDYTPAASKQVVLDTGSATKVTMAIRVEEIRTDDKERSLELSAATLSSEFSWGFLDVQEAGDVAVTSVVFNSNKGATLTYKDEVLS